MSTNAMLLSFLFALLTLSVALYASLELRMLLGYWRMKADSQGSADSDTDTSGHQPALPRSEPPTVSVLLPIYNEGATVLPLLQAVAEFDYPHERMDIQVLDDSTDETPAIVAAEIERLRREGIPISHVRRNSRKGWKAGALDHALEDSSAEFVARAREIGCHGFVAKEDAGDELIKAMRINSGGFFMSSSTGSAEEDVLGEIGGQQTGIAEQLSALTSAERKVLRHIASGLSSTQIAERNHLSVRTIHTHRQNICRKLGLSGINSLIRFASEHRETLEQA